MSINGAAKPAHSQVRLYLAEALVWDNPPDRIYGGRVDATSLYRLELIYMLRRGRNLGNNSC